MELQFTDETREAIRSANEEAKRFNHEYIGTEHLLLGLVKDSTGVVAKALQSFGVDLQMVRKEVEMIIGIGPQLPAFEKLPFSPRAKRAFEHASEVSRKLGTFQVGTEHLLFGLLRERDGVAAQVLKNLGVRNDHLLRKTSGLACSTEAGNEVVDKATNIEELSSGERQGWTFRVCSVPLVRLVLEDGFSMELTAKLAQHWHSKYVANYGHQWSDDWNEQIALSFQGKNGPALRPGINEKWYPWWEKLIQCLRRDGVFQYPDNPETWQILE